MMRMLYVCALLLWSAISPFHGQAIDTDIQQMSVEEKVGQLLMVHFIGEEANADSQKLIQEAYVGGIIYYAWANTLRDPAQVLRLSHSLQQSTMKNPHPIPLFIAIDQEGGAVNRLRKGFTIFPSNYALGLINRMPLVEETAHAIGQELQAVGININLAPVVDVNTNPKNPIIGIRAFGNSPSIVTQCGQSALKGYKRAGVIAALKHFPGHGDVTQDSHLALPVVNKDFETFMQTDLAPFANMAKSAEMIMTAHLVLPEIDSWCATLSKTILSDLLREQLGFQGIVITDSLVMEAIGKQIPSIEEATLQAFLAGSDILLLGGHKLLDSGQYEPPEQGVERVTKVHRYLVQAVKEGKISEERLNQSVQRILALKKAHSIPNNDLSMMHLQEHRELAQQIARESVKCIDYEHTLPLSFKDRKVGIIAPEAFRYEINEALLGNNSEKSLIFFSADNDMSEVISLANESDILLLFSYNAWKSPQQLKLLQAVSQVDKPVVLFVLGDPQDSELLKGNVDAAVITYGPAPCSIAVGLMTVAK